MIHVRTATLCTIAAELDEAIDRTPPEHPAFMAIMNARALYQYHLMMRLPAQVIATDHEPAIGHDETCANVDAAGTYLG